MSYESIEVNSNLSNKSRLWTIIQPWVICLSGSLLFFYEFIQLNIMNSLNIYLTKEFAYSPTTISTLTSITFTSDMCLVLVAGLLLDRISTKYIIGISMSMCILGVILMAQSHSFESFALARLLIGMGCAFCFLSSFTLATRWFIPSKLSYITGIIITVGSLGGIVAQGPAIELFDKFGWRTGLLIDAVIGVLILIWMFLVIKDAPSDHPNSQHESTHKKNGIIKSLSEVLKNKQIWYAAIFASFINLAVWIICALWGIRYLMINYNMSATEASNINSLIFLGSIIGSPIIGFISDKFSLRKTIMISSGIGVTIITSVFVFCHVNTFILSILFLMLGLLIGSQGLSYSHAANQVSLGYKATSSSLVSTMIVACPSIIQPLFGFLLEIHGHSNNLQPSDFKIAFSLMISLFIIATICSLFIDTKKDSQKYIIH